MTEKASSRRGWREKVEPGIYRAHRVGCPSSGDRKAGRPCACPYEIKVPGITAGGTRTLTLTGTRKEVRTERHRLMAEGRPEPPCERDPGTLEEFAAHYFQAKAPIHAANTIRTRDEDFRTRIAPTFGHLLLTEITREGVEVWLGELASRASSRRQVERTVATLRVILAAAVEWGRLTNNPAKGLRLPAAKTHETQAVERVLTREQLAELFANARTLRTETMLRAAGEMGLRRGEVAGLKWQDIDLSARRIEVRRQVVQERRTPYTPMRKVETPPKGRRARRAAISETFALRLADWFAESVVEGGHPADSWVWPGRDGGPMNERSLGLAVDRTCERAGLGERVNGRFRALVTPHGLRHTAASVMLGAGVPLIVVSRQLGHANPHITATIYAHLLGDDQLDLAAAVFEMPDVVTEVEGAVGESRQPS